MWELKHLKRKTESMLECVHKTMDNPEAYL